jgi:hypothetical protein
MVSTPPRTFLRLIAEDRIRIAVARVIQLMP